VRETASDVHDGAIMAKKKKRDAVYLQYKCKDGSFTVAKSASIGLMYWYGRIVPPEPIENPEPFSIHIVQTSIPFPYHPLFMSLVVAALERTFGAAPAIPEHLLEPAFCERIGRLEFTDVEKHLKEKTPEVVEYEQACLDILNWLQERGEITRMAFNEPIQPLDW
jgi:hypothetical protein